MKSFRQLTQQLGQWWHSQGLRKALSLNPLLSLHKSEVSARHLRHAVKVAGSRATWRNLRRVSPKKILVALLHPQTMRRKARHHNTVPPRVLLAIAVISLTSTIGYRFYNEPQLRAEAIAPQTLRAPDSVAVIDTKTTDENRKAARNGAVPVLMIDQSVNQEIYQSFQRLLDEGTELRQIAGAFPFVETSLLSINTQRYIRQAPEAEWQALLSAVNRSGTRATAGTAPSAAGNNAALNATQQVATIELQNYRRGHSPEDFSSLVQVLSRSRDRYTEAAEAIATRRLSTPPTLYDGSILSLTDSEWVQTRTGMRQALERLLTQGIPPGLPDDIVTSAVQMHLNGSIPGTAIVLATELLSATVQPNLVQDPEQTRLRAEQAAQAVEPVRVAIRRGEVIVRAGETITQADFVLLDHFGMSRRGINWLALGGLSAWIAVAIVILLLLERRFHSGMRRRDFLLVLLLALTAPLTAALGVPGASLPLIGLLVGSFYGSAVGLGVVGLLGLTLPLGLDMGISYLLASLIGSMVGACMAGQLRSREELALLGFAVGIVEAAVYLVLGLIVSGAAPVWYMVLTAAGIQGLIGLAWSIAALGISPYLEHLFDLVTPIRLAELSNPNRPLLKRLASDAPGTFQHTLFVASLAEAAARILAANVELVRAGTLYHDIGKMHDAMGFIENQMGGPNKHDLIDDPWVSAAIIKKHVTEGLVMARKYRLPKAIQAFIPEHQGTMLIAYFHHEAQQRAAGSEALTVNESDFRYDGPIPQSRETAIVMLADSCEAALRSLKDATPEEALAMVNRILRARWQDQQLIDSGLTRADMGRIAEIFVRVWQQFNHQRIAYPKLSPAPQPSTVGS
ncbi:MAG TPA: HDIG domain-containing metalloprotein [Chroococcidiopsis sp.]